MIRAPHQINPSMSQPPMADPYRYLTQHSSPCSSQNVSTTPLQYIQLYICLLYLTCLTTKSLHLSLGHPIKCLNRRLKYCRYHICTGWKMACFVLAQDMSYTGWIHSEKGWCYCSFGGNHFAFFTNHLFSNVYLGFCGDCPVSLRQRTHNGYTPHPLVVKL